MILGVLSSAATEQWAAAEPTAWLQQAADAWIYAIIAGATLSSDDPTAVVDTTANHVAPGGHHMAYYLHHRPALVGRSPLCVESPLVLEDGLTNMGVADSANSKRGRAHETPCGLVGLIIVAPMTPHR